MKPFLGKVEQASVSYLKSCNAAHRVLVRFEQSKRTRLDGIGDSTVVARASEELRFHEAFAHSTRLTVRVSRCESVTGDEAQHVVNFSECRVLWQLIDQHRTAILQRDRA